MGVAPWARVRVFLACAVMAIGIPYLLASCSVSKVSGDSGEYASDVKAPIAGSASDARREIVSLLRGARAADPEDAADLVAAFLTAIEANDIEPYWSEVMERGCLVDSSMTRAIVHDWLEQGIVSGVPSPDEVGERRSLGVLWEAGPHRLMNFRLAPGAFVAGREFVLLVGRDVWPYPGYRGQVTLFHLPGKRSAEQWLTDLNGTENSAHVTLPVVFGDGSDGHIRVQMYRSVESGRWIPHSLFVGSVNKDRWPWPVF